MKRTELELNKIVQKENSRSFYREEQLQELMASIKKDGLLHPIGVSTIGNGEYEVVYGNRRFMACQKLGWHSIPVSVVELKSDEDRDSLNLVENLKRTDITTHDEGRIYYMLQKQGLSIAEICARIGVKLPRVMSAIDTFRNVPEEFRNNISSTLQSSGFKKSDGKISASTASKLVGITRDAGISKTEAREVFARAVKEGLTVNDVKAISKIVKAGNTVASSFDKLKEFEICSMTFAASRSAMNRVEKKYGRKYSKVILSILMTHKELGIASRANSHHLIKKDRVNGAGKGL